MSKSSKDNAGNRFVKGRKQEALAEIESWVGGSREEIIKAGAAKVASHPAKNITEQKMLDSYLYEMSKQRFNFIVQCQWQSKFFLQKQKRKTAMMRDLLKNVDVSILSENPFTLRQKTVPAEHKRVPRKSLRSVRSKSLPKIHATPKSMMDNMSPEIGSIFVTQKFPVLLKDKKTTDLIGKKVSKQINQDDNWMWPVHDSRYLRLNEILCENYPKVVHLQAKRKNLELIASISDQKF